MRLALPAFLFVMVLPGLAAAQPAGDARVDAFREACGPGRVPLAAMVPAIEAAGWATAEESAHPEFAALMGKMRAELVPDEDMKLEGPALYTKEVDGRPLFIVGLQLTIADFSIASCYLYDFDAAQAVPEEVFTNWLGEPPVERVDEAGVITGQVWQNTTSLPGVEVRNNFVPEGSEQGLAVTGFTGVGMSLSAFLESGTPQ